MFWLIDNMYETPVKASAMFKSPMLSNMQSMKTDLQSNLTYEDSLLTDDEECEHNNDLFTSFLDEICGTQNQDHPSKLVGDLSSFEQHSSLNKATDKN